MKKIKSSILFNLFLILGLCVLIYFAFFSSLSWMTNHGDETTVPNIKGKNIDEVVKILETQGFVYDIDSVYHPQEKALSVIDVQPLIGSSVKRGRTIFLIVNQKNPPQISMPNLINLSARSAMLMLESNKLIVGDTIRRPDMAAGAILEMSINGKLIQAGQMVYQGSKIDLVIGDGYGNKQIIVPDVVGLPYQEAIAILKGNNLMVTEIWDGQITDSSTASVYLQLPTRRNEVGEQMMINEGENIDIRIKQNIEPIIQNFQ